MPLLFGKNRSPVQSVAGSSSSPSNALPLSLTVPPVPHPQPHAKVALIATAEGLVIAPATHGSERSDSAQISWGKQGKIETIKADNLPVNRTGNATVPGIVGILRLFNASYLLVIAARTHVGCLLDDTRSVYCIKDVVAIPLEESRATVVLKSLLGRQTDDDELLPGDETDVGDVDSETDDERSILSEPGIVPPSVSPESLPTSTSLETAAPPSRQIPKAELARRLSFWRKVARREKPLPKPITPLAEGLPATPPVEMNPAAAATFASVGAALNTYPSPDPSAAQQEHVQRAKLVDVERKTVKECIRLLTQGGMFFSYDFDITRGLQQKNFLNSKKIQQGALLTDLAGVPSPGISHYNFPLGCGPLSEPNAHLPLWHRVDRKYWWNHHLLSDFIEAGLHSFVLPVMNGYVEMASFHLPSPFPISEPSTGSATVGGAAGEAADDAVLVDFIIFSRRSCERAGLRYQRRGIDEDANVANFVETETVVVVDRDARRNVFSYVQIRGSIPLFWSQPQPGYALKPAPRLDRPIQESAVQLRRHFQKLSNYGPVTIVNLAEITGKESVVTLGYRDCVNELGLKDVKYQEFDFHHECKGMKYENISKLISTLHSSFATQGYFWVNSSDVLAEQRGVFRTNCIDCLDRTNVVQSAFSRYVLEQQLQAVALLAEGGQGKTEQEKVFNTVWANNGDAISRSYAGTSALKGDFTRTGKRDINGMLNDGMNSLARMYSSAFADYFTQAVIDYALGNRALAVFTEFLEKLQSTDPGEMLRLSKIRAAAIETCASRILSEGETFLAGWALFSPAELNAKMGKNFEEKILLLSSIAIYINSFDFSLDKVVMFTRVPLGDIITIQKGAYILSTLQEAARDPAENYGLLISWKTAHETSRITSYSLSNTPEAVDLDNANGPIVGTVRPSVARAGSKAIIGKPDDMQFAAFKALASDVGGPDRPRGPEGASQPSTCRQAVDVTVETIVRACKDAGHAKASDLIIEQDIISVAEAQRETTVYAKLEYYLKRRLWL